MAGNNESVQSGCPLLTVDGDREKPREITIVKRLSHERGLRVVRGSNGDRPPVGEPIPGMPPFEHDWACIENEDGERVYYYGRDDFAEAE